MGRGQHAKGDRAKITKAKRVQIQVQLLHWGSLAKPGGRVAGVLG